MKKIIALILALSMLLALCGCGSNQSNREQQGYADQEEFLKAMAKGISNRLKNLDEKERTPEEEAAYYVELVNYELKEIGKYDALTFEDELFNELAHAYINGCKTQLLSAQNYKNGNLYPSLWSAGSSARNAVIVELYSRYNLPLSGEEASQYSVGGTSYSIVVNDATDKKEDAAPYVLGTKVTKNCERGDAVLSLDKVEVKGTQIFFTATNHGDIGFASGGGGGMRVTFYDSDGYELGGNYAGLPEPWKPGVTITFKGLDYSYASYANDIAYFLAEYYVFSGSGSGSLDTSVNFIYAFDLSGKQIDSNKLIH